MKINGEIKDQEEFGHSNNVLSQRQEIRAKVAVTTLSGAMGRKTSEPLVSHFEKGSKEANTVPRPSTSMIQRNPVVITRPATILSTMDD